MALTNYRDISPSANDVGAGFQFEFTCESCGETWKSPFRPYRAGQMSGLLRRFSFIFGEFYRVGTITEMMSKVQRASGSSMQSAGSKPKQAALEEALALAADRYHKCSNCKSAVCDNCWNDADQLCIKCEKLAGIGRQGQGGDGASASAALCPNCQTPSQGGRFCHECGFDMASTHKSCPSCSATMPRQARFCTDCGHGF